MENILENIIVNISSDKMKAYITINAPSDSDIQMPNISEILKYLNDKGVVYGIDENRLNIIVNKKIFNQELMIAEGLYPVDGIDGRIDFHFDIKKDKKPVALDDGSVDFRNLDLIENVRKGQILCTIIHPLSGENGKTVTGEIIYCKEGKEPKLPIGKNVEYSTETDCIVSLIDGQLIYKNGKISVYLSCEISGDVDNSTGNIKFLGNLTIRGNVLSGFHVEAGGTVEVWGVVEGAIIKAEGDIIIRRGVQGNNKAQLISNGSIMARYIEHSSVSAKLDIKAESIMHSIIKCRGKLELIGRKGLLVGGSISAGKEISAKVIGSPFSTPTEIEVGIVPELREEYANIKQEILNLENDIKKTESIISSLTKLKDAQMLTPKKEELLKKSIKTKEFYDTKIIQLKNEYETIEERLNMEYDGKVKCLGVIYPGTKVTIGPAVMVVKEDLKYCILYRDGVDIKVISIT